MDNQDQGIINPGETPSFPAHIEAGEHDTTAVAEAAWKRSNGNIHAFEALCADHAAGRVDLLDSEYDEEAAAHVPGATPDQRAVRQAAAGDLPHFGSARPVAQRWPTAAQRQQENAEAERWPTAARRHDEGTGQAG